MEIKLDLHYEDRKIVSAILAESGYAVKVIKINVGTTKEKSFLIIDVPTPTNAKRVK